MAYSGIMDFASAEGAVNYLKAKVGAFFQLPYEYAQARKRIAAMTSVAKEKGDQTAIAKLTLINQGVSTLQGSYASIESKVKALLDQLKAYGLGFLPLLVVGAAIVAAGAVSYQLVSWGKLKTELEALEKGLPIPFSLGGGLATIGKALPWVAAAVVAVVVVPRMWGTRR